MDDRQLTLQIINGDVKAFRQLFEQYQHLVFNICFRMTGNREDAEDAAQDVFLKIFHQIGNFRGEAKLSSWIYRLTVNTCLKTARRKKLEYWFSLDFFFQEQEEPARENLPDEQIESSETEILVQRAIQQLPPRQKTALILQRYENLSAEEIARIMETSLSAVEALLHRARENLTEKLLPFKKQLQ